MRDWEATAKALVLLYPLMNLIIKYGDANARAGSNPKTDDEVEAWHESREFWAAIVLCLDPNRYQS